MLIESAIIDRLELALPVVNLFTNPNAAVDLTDCASTNSNLFRDQPFPTNAPYNTRFEHVGGGNSSSWFNQGGDTGALRNGLEPGKRYTARATAQISTALTGTAGAFARQIVAYTKIGAFGYVTTASAQRANSAGTSELSVTFDVPVGATEAFLRFFHGHTGGTIYWYKLRLSEGTETDFFDGDSYADPYWTNPDHGWDGRAGLSTSWRAQRTAGTPLTVLRFEELSYNIRRVPYIIARVVVPLPDAATLERLDPQKSRNPILHWNSTRYTRGPSGAFDVYAGSAPLAYPSGIVGRLYVREIEEDELNRTLTITAASGEVLPEDKINVAGGPFATGLTTADALVRWAVNDAGGRVVYVDAAAAAASVPAGDRRLWQPGESLAQLYESELAALDLRLYPDETGPFEVRPFTQPPTYNPTPAVLADGDDGTLRSYRARRAREDSRDATVVKATYIDGSGVSKTAYQYHPLSGVNRNGKVTTLNRAIPSSGYAQKVTERAAASAKRVTLEAHLDFACRPGRDVTVTVAGVTRTVRPEAVTYHQPEYGAMTIEGYAL